MFWLSRIEILRCLDTDRDGKEGGGGGGVTLFCPYFSAFLKKRGHFLTQKEKSQWNRVLNASKFQGSFYYAHQTQYTTDKSRRGTKVEGVRLKHLNGFTMFLTHNNSHNKDCKVGTLLILPGYVIISLSFFFSRLQEAFTCTCLRVHPSEMHFIAQSSGDYMAIFSTKRPYKLNKLKRYEGHKVIIWMLI